MKSITLFILSIGFISCGQNKITKQDVLATVGIKEEGAISTYTPSDTWNYYENVEDAGWSKKKLASLKKEYDKIGSSALMVIYKGTVLLDWGDTKRSMDIRSIRKSLLSGIIGIYNDRGELDLNKTLKELQIDDIGKLSDTEKSARFIDLIKYRSGIYHPTGQTTPGQRKKRPKRKTHKPGTHYFYNNWDAHVSRTILEQETGKTFKSSFEDLFVNQLQFEDYTPTDFTEKPTPSLSKHAGFRIDLSARDMARIGQLYINNGKWDRQQIISKNWVKETATRHSDERMNYGWGYMWAVMDTKSKALDTYEAYGAFGNGTQAIIVVPEADLVFIHRVDFQHMVLEESNELSFHLKRVGMQGVMKLLKGVLAAKTNSAKQLPKKRQGDLIEKNLKFPSSLVGTYPLNLFQSVKIVRKEHNKFALITGAKNNWTADLFLSNKNTLQSESNAVFINFTENNSKNIHLVVNAKSISLTKDDHFKTPQELFKSGQLRQALRLMHNNADKINQWSFEKQAGFASIMNEVAYYYLGKLKNKENAIKIFEANTRVFNKVGNMFDSLAEAYLNAGNTDKAITYYKKAIEVIQKNPHKLQEEILVNSKSELQKLLNE